MHRSKELRPHVCRNQAAANGTFTGVVYSSTAFTQSPRIRVSESRVRQTMDTRRCLLALSASMERKSVTLHGSGDDDARQSIMSS